MKKSRMKRSYISILSLILVITSIGILPGKIEAATVFQWSKYSVKVGYGYSDVRQNVTNTDWVSGYNSFTFDNNTGAFSVAGTYGSFNSGTIYNYDNPVGDKHRINYVRMYGDGMAEKGYYESYTINMPDIRMMNVHSSDKDAYPNNSVDTDGYYYIYEGTVTSKPSVVDVTNPGDKTYYKDQQSFTISGTLTDQLSDSSLIIASIGGVVKTVEIINLNLKNPWSLSWDLDELPVGSYTPQISVDNGIEVAMVDYQGLITIKDKVYYYWNKYRVDKPLAYFWSGSGESTSGYPNVPLFYTGFTVNEAGKTSAVGGSTFSNLTTINQVGYYPHWSDPTVIRFTKTGDNSYKEEHLAWHSIPPKEKKGTLLQTNVKAVEGTYPDDGVHTDGYWYSKIGEVPNTAPVLNVTASMDKSINLKAGNDTLVISGTVADADNDTIRVYATIGNVSKEVAVVGTKTAKAWSLTYRTSEFTSSRTYSNVTIYADDGKGGEISSLYNYKVTVNITTLYYWDKYSVKNQVTGYSESKGNTFKSDIDNIRGYRNYTFDRTTGKFSGVGSYEVAPTYPTWAGTRLFDVSSYGMTEYLVTNLDQTQVTPYNAVATSTVKVRDALQQSNILDLDKTYPDDGIHSDNFWYVKKSNTNMAPVLTVDNSDIFVSKGQTTLKLTGTIYDADGDTVTIKATIDGVEKEISKTNTRTAQAWELSWAAPPEGRYNNIQVTASDSNGGLDKITYSGVIYIDQTPPTTPKIVSDASDWVNRDVLVSITAGTDTGSGVKHVEYSLDGIVWNKYVAPIVIKVEGLSSLRARTVDLVGNLSEEVTEEIKIDKTPPQAPVVVLSDDGWATEDVIVTVGDSADLLSGVRSIEYRIGGGTWVPYTGEIVITDNGITTGYIRIIDNAGNISEVTPFTVRIDKTPPIITFSGDTEQWDTTPAVVTVDYVGGFSGIDPNERKYKLTTSLDTPSSWDTSDSNQQTITVATEGRWYLHAKVTNKAGVTVTAVSKAILYQLPPTSGPNLVLSSVTSDSITLGWNLTNASFSEGYKYRIQNTNTGEIVEAAHPDSSKEIKGLSPGTQYNFVGTIVNNVGESPQGPSLSVLTLPDVVADITLNTVDYDYSGTSFSFPAVVSADSYVAQLTMADTGNLVEEFPVVANQNNLLRNVEAGTKYTLTVSAINASGTGKGKSLSFLTLPASPGQFKTITIGETEIAMSWNPVSTAFNYELVREPDGAKEQVYYGDQLTAKDQNLTASTLYNYGVAAENDTGIGAYAKLEGIMTLPAAVTGLEAYDFSPEGFKIKWEPVVGASEYNVVLNGQSLGSSSSNIYELTGLLPGHSYIVSVAAVNESGIGASGIETFYTLPEDLNSDNVDLRVVNVTEESAEIEWNSITGADKYKIVFGATEIELSGTSAVLTGLPSGIKSSIVLYAGNESGYSSGATFEILTRPGSPNNITTSNLTSNSFTITWDAVEGATGYTIYDEQGSLIETVASNVWTYSSIEPGGERSVRVSTLNNAGEGKQASYTQRVLPDKWELGEDGKGPVVVEEVTADSVIFSWNPVAGADSYSVLDSSKNLMVTVPTNEPRAQIEGLDSSVAYANWQVVANNSAGSGEAALVPKFVTKPSDQYTFTITPGVRDLTIVINSELVNESYIVTVSGKEMYRGKSKVFKIPGLVSEKEYKVVIVTENEEGHTTLGKEQVITTLVDTAAINEATEAVQKAESSLSKDYLKSAQELVNKLINGTVKDALQDRLDAVKATIAKIAKATAAVVKAEKSLSRKDVDIARPLVEALTTEPVKSDLKDRLDAVLKKIKESEYQNSVGTGSNVSPPTNIERPPVKDKDKAKDNPVKEDTNPVTNIGTGGSTNSSKFEDVNVSSFANDAITYLSEEGIIKGVTDTMFAPNRQITRMEFAALIVRATEAPTDDSLKITYKDINTDGWYMSELNAAIANDVAKGFSATEFRPLLNINREQGAMMIGNILINKSGLKEGNNSTDFNDNSEVSGWANNAVKVISSNNIIQGYPDGTFRPKGQLTRAESAVLIYRMLEQMH